MKLSTLNLLPKATSLVLAALFFFAFLPNQTAQAQTEEVLTEVDVMPQPTGGLAGWNTYLAENLKYPEAAQEKKIEGTVIVKFVVLDSGELDQVEILRGIGGGCDEEVLRLVKEAPKWTPGKKDGEVVNVQMRLPVRFKL
ncbi:TonB family C-terminal domain-containing protein [Algoriphagus locisalis]|uniref:TonB family C-terminal domain-containing protein n=1 Tax=Algoriphagus locisalis TaxID=305507 RepID=A0A1I6Y388_9BACT|nr:energy transducer TonB [Algoriphagus locisalis]SFT44691.1 TonB family C-terminal domain-containing protein [Algoriphagus locisalis]